MQRKWWHDKVAYQIYPKSFMDSNGDGIGDIPGIISKLDYLQELGIEILWLSPIYTSPFVDQGYDIADYYDIDPIFGTMEDMDRLIAEAKKRGIHLVMDLVVNHCSDKHVWFQEMLKDPEGKYGDYFYIKEGHDGQPPNNWRSYFGGSVWEPIPGTDKYYLHMFAKEQPDLNWENEAVREDIYNMMNWWLEKGIAGFRIDAIINIKKDLSFADLPPDRDDGMSSCYHMIERADDVKIFLNEMKERTFKLHDAFSIGELFNYKQEELAQYIGEEGCFSSIFDFKTDGIGLSELGWYDRRKPRASEYRKATFDSQIEAKEIGFLANIIENHDEPRGASRYLPVGLSEEEATRGKKLLATIMFSLRGLPFIYQGQEIGMTNNRFKDISIFDDLNTIEEYHTAIEHGLSHEEALEVINTYSRDNARTPFHWDDKKHAGFTTGEPWLPCGDDYEEVNLEKERRDKQSVWNYYKEIINLRKSDAYKETFVYGDVQPCWDTEETIVAFIRKSEERQLLIVANYDEKEQTFSYDTEVIQCLLGNREQAGNTWHKGVNLKGGIVMKPFESVILEVVNESN